MSRVITADKIKFTDGSEITTVPVDRLLYRNRTVLTASSGTYTVPAGITEIFVRLINAGSSAGSVYLRRYFDDTTVLEINLGRSGYSRYRDVIISVTPGQNIPYTIPSPNNGDITPTQVSQYLGNDFGPITVAPYVGAFAWPSPVTFGSESSANPTAIISPVGGDGFYIDGYTNVNNFVNVAGDYYLSPGVPAGGIEGYGVGQVGIGVSFTGNPKTAYVLRQLSPSGSGAIIIYY